MNGRLNANGPNLDGRLRRMVADRLNGAVRCGADAGVEAAARTALGLGRGPAVGVVIRDGASALGTAMRPASV